MQIIATLSYSAQLLFGWVVIALSLSWLLALGYPLFSRLLASISPKMGAFITLSYGLLALICAGVTIALMALPQLSFMVIEPHCHGNNCQPHDLHMTTDTLAGLVSLSSVISLLVVILIAMLLQVRSSHRQLQSLDQLSDTDSEAYRIIPTQQHIAWCAGLFKPTIFLSRGLIDAFPELQRRAVVAHELSHAIRRDNLRNWLLYWGTWIWPRYQRSLITSQQTFYHEQIADLAAIQVAPLEIVIAAINACNANCQIHRISKAQLNYKRQRIDALIENTFTSSPDNRLNPAYLKLLITALWIVTTLLLIAIRFGHPLLEWLGR